MKKLAHLSGIAFSSIFGLSFLFSKIALNYIQPITLIAFRFLLAFLVIEILRLLKIIRIQFSKNKLKAILPIVLFQPILYFLSSILFLNKKTSLTDLLFFIPESCGLVYTEYYHRCSDIMIIIQSFLQKNSSGNNRYYGC